jgi:hypothetical protein
MAENILNTQAFKYTLHVPPFMVKTEWSVLECYSFLKNLTSIIFTICMSNKFEIKMFQFPEVSDNGLWYVRDATKEMVILV